MFKIIFSIDGEVFMIILLGYMSHKDGDEHWCLPQPNSVKVDSDTSIFEESNYCNHAFAVRNHEGRLVEARSKCL